MAVDVYAWPPVGLTGWGLTRSDPIAVSRSMLTGRRFVSAHGRSRRLATASVSSLGADRAAGGYIEMLKEYLNGGAALVRVECFSHLSYFARSQLTNRALDWTDGGSELLWSSSGVTLEWFEENYEGSATTDSGWPALAVTGLPPSRIVVRPHELVTLIGAGDGSKQQARAVRVARSDADGNATIRIKTAMTGSGPVSIGERESIVFEALDMPRAVQKSGRAEWEYTWNFSEVFADEVTGGFNQLDPWT